jgi:hypothetical protein
MLFSITAKIIPSHYFAHSAQDSSALHREVLLSYRLLFGQSSSSRKLLSQILSQSSRAATRADSQKNIASNIRTPLFSEEIFDDTDPFLHTICTSPFRSRWHRFNITRWHKSSPLLPSSIFPSSALDLNNQLQESETYSTREDFPVFGPRLLIIQKYNLRQQPSKVKDLWRDRRSPLQWYTFWAVLWIGGASIIMEFLQLLVGVAQLYFAISPSVGGNGV